MAPQLKRDRRKYPRHFVRILVDFSASDTFLYDYSNDLSEGGIFIQTSSPLDEGEQLDLRFTLPGTDRLFQLRGEVTWVNRADSQVDSEESSGDVLDDLLEGANEPDAGPGDEDNMPEGMGIKFQNITPEEQNLLREFLKKETY